MNLQNIKKNVLAVDPGASGGFATFTNNLKLNKGVQAAAIPQSDYETIKMLRAIIAGRPDNWVCYMEQVGGYIGEEQPGSRMFNFGDSFGYVRGAIEMAGVSVRLVRPQIWQRGIPNRVGEKRERKNALKAWAQLKFPELKVTLSTADALCILYYAVTCGYSESLEAKHEAAIAWCQSQGYAVPEFGSDSFKQMFAYWCLLQKRGGVV